MAKTEDKTPVLFRMMKDNTDGGTFLIALFPTLPGTNDPATCNSYMHVGQHGSADLQLCMRASRPAKPAEYADLARELRGAPYHYKLEIKSRVSRAMNNTRRAQLR
jgi:hypothetical protein